MNPTQEALADVRAWQNAKPASHIETVFVHLGAASMQRSSKDDKIIADHVDAALKSALLANLTITELLAALRDIEWIVEDKADIDHNGNANDAMTILAVVHTAMRKAGVQP